jgi:hypothetical protein
MGAACFIPVDNPAVDGQKKYLDLEKIFLAA